MFKIGQRVRVREDFTDEDTEGAGYMNAMERYRGQFVTINKVVHKHYTALHFKETGPIFWNAKQVEALPENNQEALSLLKQVKECQNAYQMIL